MKKITISLLIAGSITCAVIVLAGVFYWFEWRPSQITKECQMSSIERSKQMSDGGIREDAIYFFGKCMREHGIIVITDKTKI